MIVMAFRLYSVWVPFFYTSKDYSDIIHRMNKQLITLINGVYAEVEAGEGKGLVKQTFLN